MTNPPIPPAVSPYRIEGPALISFSGGRTSAFMLHEILAAHGGQLPAEVHVCFANTGKEREETLRFVHECESRWGVKVHWIEWREWSRGTAHAERFREVGYNSASRSGEPFSDLIKKLGFVPNAFNRFCSVQLKIRPIEYFARSIGFGKGYKSVVGLRHDEGHRCLKQYARNEANKDIYVAVCPMDKARATVHDVLRFWLGPSERLEDGARPQGFDLGLRSFEGNCDLCFLKSRGKLAELISSNPAMASWWIEQERTSTARKITGRQFNREETFEQLVSAVQNQTVIDFSDDQEHDVECGLTCAA